MAIVVVIDTPKLGMPLLTPSDTHLERFCYIVYHHHNRPIGHPRHWDHNFNGHK